MSLRKTLVSHRDVPPWLLPVFLIGSGLYFGWGAARPDGLGFFRSGDVGNVLSASADYIGDTKEYLDHTETLHRALEEGDREVIQRLMVEQEALNRRIEERSIVMRATEEKGRVERASAMRWERVTLGIAGTVLLSLGVWTLVVGRGKKS